MFGFGRKSRKRAREAQWGAYNNYVTLLRRLEDVVGGEDTRLRELSDEWGWLRRGARGRLEGVEAGRDWMGVYGSHLGRVLNEGSDLVRRSMDVTEGMGSNVLMQGDAGYRDKLRAWRGVEVARGVGRALAEGVSQEVWRDRELMMAAMGQEAEAGSRRLSGYSGLLQGWLGALSSIGQIRQMEIMRGQSILGGVMGLLQMGLGFTGGLGNLWRILRGGSGSSNSGGSGSGGNSGGGGG